MRKNLLFCIGIFSFVFGFAQKESCIWYFGVSVGLNFNSGEPKVSNNGRVSSAEGSASICTKEGRLLFYTDGVYVWDSSHSIMPNGSNLFGHPSTTQSSIIIPKPGNNKKFYIFTVDQGIKNNKGLCYSELDMDLNSGYGDIVSDKKNIQLTNQTNEKLAATYHSNGKDIWVLIHKFYTTDSIYAYLVTQAGVQTSPVKSTTGYWAPYSPVGQMKISPNGKKIAIAHYSKNIIVGDFNSKTGKVSNTWLLPYPTYGLEFSASAKFLYTSRGADLLQYDLTSNYPNTILASEMKVDRDSSNDLFWAFQLGPDGKIYIAKPGSFLDVIHSPDSKGTMCKFENNSIYLNNEFCELGLPNFISSSFDWINFDIKGVCLSDSIKFNIPDLKNSDSIKWDFGDSVSGVNNFSKKTQNVYHIYSKKGRYKISLTSYKANRVIKGYQYLNIIHPSSFLLPFQFFCKGDTLKLEANREFESYKWNTGAKSKDIKVQKAGIYSLEVLDSNNCVGSDTVSVMEIYDKPNLGLDALICKGYPIVITPQKNYKSYKWDNDSITKSLNVYDSGTYILTVIDSFGCQFSDTIFTRVANLKASFDITDVCENDSAIFINKSMDANAFKWKFGDGNSSNKKSPNYMYQINGISRTFNVNLLAFVTENCKDSITKQVTINNNPNSDFNFLLNQNIVEFKATQPSNTDYKWQFGNGDSSSTKDITYIYPKAGNYKACLKVTNAANCFSETCKDISVTVGSSNFIKLNGFKIVPNPNSGSFTISNLENKEILTVEIMNQIGQIVLKTQLNEYSKEYEINLANGIYFIKVNDGENFLNQRIVVSK